MMPAGGKAGRADGRLGLGGEQVGVSVEEQAVHACPSGDGGHGDVVAVDERMGKGSGEASACRRVVLRSSQRCGRRGRSCGSCGPEDRQGLALRSSPVVAVRC